MKILLDECVPKHLGPLLTGHSCITVAQKGWRGVLNGELLMLAQKEFDVFLTVDQNITFQQDLRGVSITVMVIQALSNAIEDIQPFVPKVLEILSRPLRGGAIILER